VTEELEPIKPTCPWPMSVAVEELTGFEVLGIETHYRTTLDKLGAIGTLIGAVWAYESRTTSDGKPASWRAIEGMTIRALTGYFEPEPDDIDPDSPDSDLGKESSPRG